MNNPLKSNKFQKSLKNSFQRKFQSLFVNFMYHEHIENNKFKLSANQLIRTTIPRYIYLA